MNNEILNHLHEFAKILHRKPSLWKEKQFDFLKRAISYAESESNCKNIDSDSDEECPPPEIQEELSYRSCIEKAKETFEINDYNNALYYSEKSLKINPNSAKALRIRSQSNWYLNNNIEQAYLDLCEAQRIDYDDEYDIMLKEMKEANDLIKSNSQSTSQSSSQSSSQSTSQSSSLPGIDSDILKNFKLDDALNNPEFMKLAQNMMSDPNMMANMANMANMFKK
mgnify:CR=1 FL=1